ncbi:MAG: hypothetical protein CVT82_12075 [Alphaproteobacteria bacterium HGW-Alphaproteobacteria-4]|jgi:DsbC/DsbD-like thiol-disulfide interchange protein|nr:MAG: hypothetical protein CVT82_12075 [Alphaproteobacteria bacterium HGW-Alphaproteobacteria-4]
MKSYPTLLASLAFAFFVPQATTAQPWMPGFVSAELVGGWRTERGTQMTALRVVLEDGWKTYWRAPGDAGIPPEFNWRGSHNAAEITIHWPRPHVFESAGLRTVGYLHEMILPIEITPTDPALDVWMAGEVSFGICREICVPVIVNVENLLQGPGNASDDILAALAAMPEQREGIARCAVEPVLDGVRVTAEINLPQLGRPEVALFELSGVSSWVSESISSRTGDVLTSTVEIVPYDARPFDLERRDLRITVLGGDNAVEIRGCLG